MSSFKYILAAAALAAIIAFGAVGTVPAPTGSQPDSYGKS